MCDTYCISCKKHTKSTNIRKEISKNGRMMEKSICMQCKKGKSRFIKSQMGGALYRKKGPNITDKIAYVGSMVVNPTASWGALGRVLASQAYKGVKDNFDYYKSGKGVDIHNAILKVAPKKGFVLPGHRYTGPGNPLQKQVRWDDNGNILHIYEQPTGKTDAVSMQHDVDYSVCSNKPKADQVKCKNDADRKMVKALDAIPWKDRQWGHAVARNTIAAKAKSGLGVKKPKKKRKKPSSEENWQEKLADELHKPIKRNFTRRRVIVNHIDEIWCSDLVEMQQFSKWNKGFRYLLMVLDVFSKYGWIVPLKDKKGETVSEALKTILKEGRKPQYLWTDKGKEYYNKHVKELLDKNKITLYSTQNEEKSSVCERWNRTIKTKMWKQFTVQGNTQYLDMLPKLVKQYNNTKHSSIKMTPIEASKKKNEGIVYFNLYGDMEPLLAKPKFKIGDKVRISKYKRDVFDKGYTPNWTEEVFTVDKMQYTNPITYKLKDLRGEDIQGSFYEPELLKAKQDVFRIDKVIRRDYKKKQALVKWKGYSDEFNSWIPMKDLQHV